MIAYRRRLAQLELTEIDAGHLGGIGAQIHPNGKGVTTKAQVAKFVQHGTPRMKARPFMDVAYADLQTGKSMNAPMRRALNWKKPMVAGLIPRGLRSAEAIKQAIITLDAIDTGTTRDSARYQIHTAGHMIAEGGSTGPRAKRKRLTQTQKRIRRAGKKTKRIKRRLVRRAKKALR